VKIHRIQGIAFSSYLIETPAALFLVDSGFRWFEGLIVQKVRAIGRSLDDLALAVLTHPHIDHVGAIAALLKRADFEIVAHPASREALAAGGRAFSPPTRLWTRAVQRLATSALPLLRLPAIVPTIVPTDGQRLDRYGLPGTLYFTPGHSKWCISLLLDDGTAFAGDLLVGPGHMTRAVSPPAMAADPIGAIHSMRKLLDAGAICFMPAHGRAFGADDVRSMLAALDSSFALRRPGAANEGRG
jgi:glyoxylase-like metal-dependent hydrolase (beta-lactamase superfamily II)